MSPVLEAILRSPDMRTVGNYVEVMASQTIKNRKNDPENTFKCLKNNAMQTLAMGLVLQISLFQVIYSTYYFNVFSSAT